MKKPKLIPEWQRAWRFFSVQLLALLGILAALYSELPALQAALAPATFAKVSAILALAAILARVIKQRKPP